MTRDDRPQDARDLGFDDIHVGQEASFERTIRPDDIARFAELTGDRNPLHVDGPYGERSPFKSNIAHGLLIGGLMSTIVGMYCPGKRSLYLSQTFNFRQPVLPGDEVRVKGTVTAKSDSTRVITLRTEIYVKDRLVIDGEARVRLL